MLTYKYSLLHEVTCYCPAVFHIFILMFQYAVSGQLSPGSFFSIRNTA